MLGSACYIEGAMSSMLFLALEFHDDVLGGVLANANCGGMLYVWVFCLFVFPAVQ